MQIVDKNFENALTFTLLCEGVHGSCTGYVNDPADPGGETNYGIIKPTYDTYRKLKNLPPRSIRLIDRLEVTEIYYLQFWHPAGCDLLPAKLALCHFDWAVNHGVIDAIRDLQRLVGTAPDGRIGPNTKQAITRALTNQSERSLCIAYCILRENWYRHRVATKPSQAKFLQGWLNRVAVLRKAVS